MDVVADFKLELNFAASKFVFGVLLLACLDDVLRHLVRKAFENVSVLAVVDEQFHVADLVVKSNRLSVWEHTASGKDFFCYC